uniref:Uncharacterized protein n=1 Tax=Arundo donax TaxID=35708 RepID=A0A0A9HM92_ARUDO
MHGDKTAFCICIRLCYLFILVNLIPCFQRKC